MGSATQPAVDHLGSARQIPGEKSLGLYRERSGRESLRSGKIPEPERSRYGDLQ